MSDDMDLAEPLPDGVESVEHIARLSREEVDALPYGLMVFDRSGTVRVYNRYESELSRRRPEQVVARNWFRDVAPCTRVAAFEGRFRSFVDRDDKAEVMRFEFRFHFLHGAQDVEVTFAHAPDGDGIFVIVTRRVLGAGGRRLDVTEPVRVREDGRAHGGLGSALTPPRLFWATAFDALDDKRGEARELLASGARAWGRAVVEGIEQYAERVHKRALPLLPTLLAVALIDEAFGAQGLGRIDFDFGGAAHGVLGIAVRPADLPRDVAEILYGALVTEVVRALTGRELGVRHFATAGELMRFAATTKEKVGVIDAWRSAGLGPVEIAAHAGLEVW